MGWLDYLTDITSALTIGETAADHPPADDNSGDNAASRDGMSTKSSASDTNGESGGENEVDEADGEKGKEPSDSGDEENDEEEEEEEEEEEPQDLQPKFEEECMKTQQCAPLKHHYDECVERVQQQEEEHGKAQEDCVEEFFHMMHCATQCAAPKLFRALR